MAHMSEEAMAERHFGPRSEKLSDRINKYAKSQEMMGILGEVVHLEDSNAALLEALEDALGHIGVLKINPDEDVDIIRKRAIDAIHMATGITREPLTNYWKGSK
jgi:hypothetical protein